MLLGAGLFSGVYLAGIHNTPEKKSEKSLSEPLPKSSGIETKTTAPSQNKLNATEAFAAGIAKTLIQGNPNGPVPKDGSSFINALNPDIMVNTAISEAIDQIGYESFEVALPKLSITIVKTNSLSSLTTYFSELEKKLLQARDDIGTLGASPSQADFLKAALTVESLANSLKKITVPEPVSDLHLKLTSLLFTEVNIFKAIGNAETDPVRGIAALHLLPTVFTNIQTVQAKLVEAKKTSGIE